MVPVLVERTACPVCEAEEFATLFETSYDGLQERLTKSYESRGGARPAALLGENYVLCQCAHCHMIFQKGVPSAALADEIYGQWIDKDVIYNKKFYPLPLRHFDHALSTVRLMMNALPRKPRDVRFLDFGMGWGDFSAAAQAYGADVTGVELSEDKLAHGAGRGISVAKAPDGHYHAILLNQVLEHLSDPVDILTMLKEHLAPDGIIYVTTPNGAPVYKSATHFGWREFKTYGKIVAPLEHLNVFTNQTLARVGQTAGLAASAPPPVPLHRETTAALKGRVFKRLGLADETAASVFYRHP